MSDSDNSTETVGPNAEIGGIAVRVFGRTDVGLVRDHNEDNFLIADLTASNRSIKPEVRTHKLGARGSLFAVCDGMGGAAAGEVASQIGVDTIYEIMQEGDPARDDNEIARRLNRAICEAGTRIFTAAKINRGQRGMGTTSTVAALIGDRVVFGQVGDSRAYMIRQGKLVQMTKDQSLVQQLIDAKQLTEEEAKDFDRSNIILQALGTTEGVHVDVTSADLRRGDALVMCSDGLSGLVEPDDILEVVKTIDEPMEACRRLTEMACDRGGEDNITVIVARFEGDGLAEPSDGVTLTYEKFDYIKTTETTSRSPVPKFDDDETKDEEKETVPSEEEPESKPDPEPEPESKPEPEPESKPEPDGKEQQDQDLSPRPPFQRGKGEKSSAVPLPVSGRGQGMGKDIGPKKKGGARVVIGVLATLVVLGGIGGYLVMGSGNESGPAEGNPIIPANTATSPAVVPIEAGAWAPVQPVQEEPPVVAEPRLAPVAEEAISGGGVDDKDDGADDVPRPPKKVKDSAKDPDVGSVKDEPPALESEAKKGSDTGGEPSKSMTDKKETVDNKKTGKKKKKKEPVIDDNPY